MSHDLGRADEVWQKWSAPERPAEMFAGKCADEVLFAEVRRLVGLSQI